MTNIDVQKILSILQTVTGALKPHSFNNYLPIGVGNETTIEFDVCAKAWFWSDKKLKRHPLDLFFADFIISLEKLEKVWDLNPAKTSYASLPNGTEAKYTIHRVNNTTKISVGFTDYNNHCQSGELSISEFRILLRTIRTIFGAFINEDNPQLGSQI
jgi:hypothetical protein